MPSEKRVAEYGCGCTTLYESWGESPPSECPEHDAEIVEKYPLRGVPSRRNVAENLSLGVSDRKYVPHGGATVRLRGWDVPARAVRLVGPKETENDEPHRRPTRSGESDGE